MSRAIYPILRYTDARAAIEFLTTAFGFEVTEVSEGEGGAIVHAELTYGDGLVMLSRLDDDAAKGRSMVYVAVDDADAHHDQATAAGAEITQPLTDQPYGSREYGALDPEGNHWYFGTYSP
jgi:uncharacterized glyoxalase superfamily protein PhnB